MTGNDVAKISLQLVGIEGTLSMVLTEVRTALKQMNLSEEQKVQLMRRVAELELIEVERAATIVALRADLDRVVDTLSEHLKDHA